MVFPYEKGWTFHRAYAMAVRSGEVISWVDMSDIPARITRKSVRATAE